LQFRGLLLDFAGDVREVGRHDDRLLIFSSFSDLSSVRED
jgi:hypothetical protein